MENTQRIVDIHRPGGKEELFSVWIRTQALTLVDVAHRLKWLNDYGKSIQTVSLFFQTQL